MADDRNFTLKIITPDRVFYEEEVSMVEFNTVEGEVGVYKDHIPMTILLMICHKVPVLALHH